MASADAVAHVHLRRIRPADAMGLVEFHDRLSPESRYLRFFSAKRQLSPDEARWFADVDFEHRVAFVATTEESSFERIIAVARFDRMTPTGPSSRSSSETITSGVGSALPCSPV